MKLPVARVEKLIWILIYGGLISIGVGVALLRDGAWFAWGVIAVAALAATTGVVLVWVRSRMRDPTRP